MDRLSDQSIELWRSEEMELVRLLIPKESARATVYALAELGLLQYRELNPQKSAFQRNYANQVRRCDEMMRRLRFFHEQVAKAGLPAAAPTGPPSGPSPATTQHDLDDLAGKLEVLERELTDMIESTDRLERTYNELLELQAVLEQGAQFFSTARAATGAVPMLVSVSERQLQEASLIQMEGGGPAPQPPQLQNQQGDARTAAAVAAGTRVGFVAGTIPVDKLAAFERILFRATRGNVFLRHGPTGRSLKDPATGEPIPKHVFVVSYAGDRSRAKTLKICEAFGANRYPFPADDVARQHSMEADVAGRIADLGATVEGGQRHRRAMLASLAATLGSWTLLVRQEKAVCHTLNKMNVDVTSRVLVAEAWVPCAAKAQVQRVLRETAASSHTQLHAVVQSLPIPSHDPPPTHFATNKFNAGFQALVDAYGVARYREVNPAVLTIMTFPFLFAVMFGDFGHALIMVAFAAVLVVRERVMATQDLGDMLSLLFGGRYIILLMGIYSFYMGLIYNEFFSMPTVIFGDTRFSQCVSPRNGTVIASGIDPRDCLAVYDGVLQMPPGSKPIVFGLDPIWHGRKTELSYLNSVKMKMSILIGVAHMNFGILNSLFNNLYFRDWLSIWAEFVPQVIFLNSIFGYLCLLIVLKWASGKITDLYHVMIYMFLSPGSAVEHQLIPGQAGLQVFLLLAAFVAVPWMLLPKPLILRKRHQRMSQAANQVYGVEMGSAHVALPGDDVEARRSQHRGGGALLAGMVNSSSSSHETSSAAAAATASHGGGDGHGVGGHGGHSEFEFGEVMVHQMIHTIEFVLNAVSNTASYLRLWALSLAHSQLAGVFYDRVLMAAISTGNVLAMVVGFFFFAVATLGVLMVMESLSAFLHALRLHWVEYNGKFYRGDGHAFVPFSFARLRGAQPQQGQQVPGQEDMME